MSLLPTTSDINLIITGSIGPSQLIVVRRVAERLGLRFVNAEREFERQADMPPAEFKALFGEARLRTLESEVISTLALYRGVVIHMNGQMLAYSDHLNRMRASSYILCLVASLDAWLTRLHVALGARFHNPSERALALGNLKRDWLIRGQPGVHELDTTHLTEQQTVDQIVALWAERVIEFTRIP